MIRTNSKVSQNTNSNSNKGSNRENAKAVMRSMLKKKSTMLFVQENTDANKLQNSSIIPPKKDNSPGNTGNFMRRTTLMPDFRSNLLNKSSKFKRKDNKSKDSKQSSKAIGIKKFK